MPDKAMTSFAGMNSQNSESPATVLEPKVRDSSFNAACTYLEIDT